MQYTIDELGRTVGMSPRNIRAHQARRLLAPPVRKGRTAYYDDGHVRRLETVKALQRQGFNLVAIEAMLGLRDSDPAGDPVAGLLQRLNAEQPSLVHALVRHGVVVRAEDRTLRLVRPRALRSALELRRTGVRPVPSLQVLGEVLDSVHSVAEELIRATGARVIALSPGLTAGGGRPWVEVDQEAVALTQGLVDMLTEAFRTALENHGHTSVMEFIAQGPDVDLALEDTSTVDTG
ncbi:MerR family transcriptional regulator [Actinoplanes sp. HUAS TT8]|uniref:MerR family transcriptional regulator n=1 Tax=Actinoplanes sp. HUAS TT8 TaxID=3447453 RepID=UPI003F5257B6